MTEQWKLVPVEPTKEMWDAVNKLDNQMAAGGYDGKGCSIEQAWDCMIDAAPTQGSDEPLTNHERIELYELRDAVSRLADDAQPVAIYQLSTWPENVYQDVDKDRFDMDDGDRPKRIVYAIEPAKVATPSPSESSMPVAMPEGWRMRIEEGAAVVQKEGLGGVVAYADDASIAAAILHALVTDLIATRDAALKVWYGSMPESNGKTNWTAILHRGDISEGFTIDRSEYPDRVRYEADRVRYLIGEIEKEPWILDYDADKHSGYVPRDAAPRDAQPIAWIDPIDLEELRHDYSIRFGASATLYPSQGDPGHKFVPLYSVPVSGEASLSRIAEELRNYNPAADEYKGEHIHKVWAREIDKAIAASAPKEKTK